MKTHLAIITCIVIMSAGCQEDLTSTESATPSNSFIILDQDSKQTLSEYKYSDDGKTLVSSKSYDEDEVLEKSVTYEYDDSGLLSRTIEVDAETSETTDKSYTYSKTYNEDGSLSRIVESVSDGQKLIRNICYDQSGNILSVTEESDNSLGRIIEGKNYE